MGKKGKWLSSLKKAFSPESKEKKNQKSKENLFGKQKDLEPTASESTTLETVRLSHPQPQEVKLTEAENGVNAQNGPPYSIAVINAAPADAAITSAPTDAAITFAPTDATITSAPADSSITAAVTAVEVVPPTTVNQFAGKSKEEAAAIKIQKAFRGYQARRAVRALRGLFRLKSLMEGNVVKRQATNTLRCMQTLSRVQCQIHTRRIRMTEANQALQRQLLQKHAKELANLRIGEEWDDSLQSKEQIEAGLVSKHDAAMKRERALAYAFTHQQNLKNSLKTTNALFTDPRNPTWGWSWLERWMAARPWEGRSILEKELNNDLSSVKSASHSIIGGEITKSSPTPCQKPSFQFPSTPKPASSGIARKLKAASPRGNDWELDDDCKSMVSMQSERPRRHSIGSSVRDDESLASSPSVPSYMVPTKSARAKARLQSPLGEEANGIGTPERGTNGVAKKRLSYPHSPAKPRRYSGPPKLENSVNNAESVINGGES
ncbi:hypothetical protein SLA2020_508150 [Shorea laevis]